MVSKQVHESDVQDPQFPVEASANPDSANPDFANPDSANPDSANPDVATNNSAKGNSAEQTAANHALTNHPAANHVVIHSISTPNRLVGQSSPIQPLKVSPPTSFRFLKPQVNRSPSSVNLGTENPDEQAETDTQLGEDAAATTAPVSLCEGKAMPSEVPENSPTFVNSSENASWNASATLLTNERMNRSMNESVESLHDRRRWRWTMILLTAFGIFGGVGTSAFLWLTNLPPLPDCQYVNAASPNSQQLYCAQEKAKSGKVEDLVAAMKQLQNWRSDQPYYQESRQVIDDWSAQVFAIAQRKYDQGDVKGAIEAVQRIPKTTKIHAQSEKAAAQWQEQWQQGKGIYDQAVEAINAKKWNEASRQIVAFSDLVQVSWAIQKADALRQRLTAEIQGNDILARAKSTATSGIPEQLKDAIALVNTIVPDTNVGKEAAALRQQWTEAILTISMQRWESGEISESFAAARQLPLGTDLPGHGEDLVRLSYAYELSDAAVSNWEPSLEQLWNLKEAIAVVQPIQPGSPFFPQALESRQSWQAQLEDLTQLKFANLTANLGFQPTLKLAIVQANEIAANRPRRLQAQTLAAAWTEELDRMADRPYLAIAQSLAEPGDIPHLKLAIQQAQQIPSERPIWQEAKTAIDRWQQQIQTIEDRPIIKQAEGLAKAKKFDEAIKIATKIAVGRALHPQAKAAIANWQAEIRRIQIAADRPILDRAYALAAKGSLTRAIEVASQIAPGRALSGEAWQAIALWDKQRNPPEPESIEESENESIEDDNAEHTEESHDSAAEQSSEYSEDTEAHSDTTEATPTDAYSEDVPQ